MTVAIYTDGSSLGNPGPGGFCAIIKVGHGVFIVKGGDVHTTNNRMELSAIIAGLYYVQKKFPVEKVVNVYSDSQLVINTMAKRWKRKKNLDLWEKLDALVRRFEKIAWHWVKGHAGHPENTQADKIAVAEAREKKKAARRPITREQKAP